MRSDDIRFSITPEQAEQICNLYGKNCEDLSKLEICELLDRLIDETTQNK